TVVEFHLEATSWGTRLKVTESGFNKIPSERREKAYEMNEGGWSEQMKNIDEYLTGGHA
ncbi:MAG: SRPBCC domain-containing protein, partial [Bdellovibrio sp.]|nr:SRPBCC domain-containing protein [Bdellovibrio sp.]